MKTIRFLPVLSNEEERVKRLHDTYSPHFKTEAEYEEITKLASQICNTPIAVICMREDDRLNFKNNSGQSIDAANILIASSFCKTVIDAKTLQEYQDLSQDPVFSQHPQVVAEPYLRYYAGAPIMLSDHTVIGTLCVLDIKPHQLSSLQKSILNGLAGLVAQKMLRHERYQLQLEDHASQLAAIVEGSQDAIVSKTLDGIVQTWNEGAEKIFGYTADEMIGKSVYVIVPEGHHHEEMDFLDKIRQGQSIKHYETLRKTKSGQLIDVSLTISPIRNNVDNAITGMSIIARDISLHKHMLATMQEQHARLKVTMDSIGDAVVTTNQMGIIDYINPVAEQLTGWRNSEAIGMPISEILNIFDEKTQAKTPNPIEKCLREKRIVNVTGNSVLLSKYGQTYGIEDSAAPIYDQQGDIIGAILVLRDVTSQRVLSNEMVYRATHDLLTGIKNRSQFEYTLEQVFADSQEFKTSHALMYIDLDQFKVVNDTCGHQIGDQLLKEVVDLIKKCIRTTDTFGRLGGDEFGIILERCTLDAAKRIAEHICNSIEEYRFQYEQRRFPIGASIGLVMINPEWNDTTTLLQAADSACYAAKEAGRSRVQVYSATNNSIELRRGESFWAAYLQRAIEENRFALFCQRIMPIHGEGKIHGEILLRLRDETGKLVLPSTFFPAAERYHLASRIDRWVIRETFEWLQHNHQELDKIDSLAINLSGQSLSDPQFHQFVVTTLENLRIDCSKVCFEVTETAAITNIHQAIRFIDLMKQHRIRFSLDDFGSGVSSFGYLKMLPVDYLKIDGQFIRDLMDNPIDRATVRCISEVAKATNKKTIAEWVESESVEALLKDMDIDFIQGYRLHRPAPIQQLLKQPR